MARLTPAGGPCPTISMIGGRFARIGDEMRQLQQRYRVRENASLPRASDGATTAF
jgi:hypothetical protein